MKLVDDVLQVIPAPAAAAELGAPVEPEEAPANRIIEVEASARLQDGTPLPHAPRSAVTVEAPAGVFAAALKDPCISCRWFDREAWVKKFGEMRKSQAFEDVRRLEALRATGLVHARDVAQLGVCLALSELARDMTLVAPDGQCPDDFPVGSGLQLEPKPYRMRDEAAAAAGSASFDAVMRSAEGR